MMTSFACILGLVPLVIATGAASESRRGVGTAVFGGMIAASAIGIFVIPMLYVVIQRLRERIKSRFGAREVEEGPEVADPERRSEEHTSELQSLMRISYAVFFLKTNLNTPSTNTRRTGRP